MFFKIMRTRKGFTIVELMVVVAILGILVAVGVPVYISSETTQKKKDCQNQRIIIETLVKEAMNGMMDNGKAQYKLVERFDENNRARREAGDYAYKSDPSGELWIDFSKVPAGHKTTYTINGEEKPCFVLIYGDKDIDGDKWEGKGAFTLGDLRGGYADTTAKKTSLGLSSGEALTYKYAIYGKIKVNKGDLPTGYGYYLKKSDLADKPFYEYFAQQGSVSGQIPECPFGDEYKYYIFEDGSVICSCPHCNE